MLCIYTHNIHEYNYTLWTYRIYKDNFKMLDSAIKIKQSHMSYIEASLLPICAAINWIRKNYYSIYHDDRRDIRVFTRDSDIFKSIHFGPVPQSITDELKCLPTLPKILAVNIPRSLDAGSFKLKSVNIQEKCIRDVLQNKKNIPF